MKQVFQTFFFQLVCVVLFGFLYWNYSNDFSLHITDGKKRDLRILDCFYTSVTVQSGVGYSILQPQTNEAVLILMTQQLIMIFSNMLILYLFSMHIMSIRNK